MEKRFSFLALAAALTLLSSVTWAKVEFDSNQLMMKNSEQITELVKKRIKKAQDIQAKQEVDDDLGIQTEPEAVDALKEGMWIILARPDQDGTRSNVFARLRRELTDLNAFDGVLKDIANESISALKSASAKPRRQATFIVVLENLMAELKPEISTHATFKSIIEQVRDADLKVTDKLKNQALLDSMSTPVSPSETAAKIVPKEDPKKKK